MRAPDDVHDLLGVGVGVTGLDGVSQAAGDVVLHDQQRDGVDRGPQRGRLLEDVDAVLVALDHPADAPDLALDARQAAQQLRRDPWRSYGGTSAASSSPGRVAAGTWRLLRNGYWRGV